MKKSKPTISTNEVASKLDVTRAAVTQWLRQGLFSGAFVEETPRGPVWHIPRAALKTFKRPKSGRPRQSAAGEASRQKQRGLKKKSPAKKR